MKKTRENYTKMKYYIQQILIINLQILFLIQINLHLHIYNLQFSINLIIQILFLIQINLHLQFSIKLIIQILLLIQIQLHLHIYNSQFSINLMIQIQINLHIFIYKIKFILQFTNTKITETNDIPKTMNEEKPRRRTNTYSKPTYVYKKNVTNPFKNYVPDDQSKQDILNPYIKPAQN